MRETHFVAFFTSSGHEFQTRGETRRAVTICSRKFAEKVKLAALEIEARIIHGTEESPVVKHCISLKESNGNNSNSAHDENAFGRKQNNRHSHPSYSLTRNNKLHELFAGGGGHFQRRASGQLSQWTQIRFLSHRRPPPRQCHWLPCCPSKLSRGGNGGDMGCRGRSFDSERDGFLTIRRGITAFVFLE